MNIQNNQAKSVGEVNDFVIDTSTGQIRYSAVTYGGFLGVGNKVFAVPFGAFKFQQDPDNRDKNILVLDVTQKQHEGSTGFDEDHWPNFADQKFTSERPSLSEAIVIEVGRLVLGHLPAQCLEAH